jgi:hypothetical protein
MLSDFLELLLYPLLLFIVPFVAVVIMLGISDYMDSKEGKTFKDTSMQNKESKSSLETIKKYK